MKARVSVTLWHLIIIIIIYRYGAPSRKSPERLQKYKDTLILSHTHTHTTNTCAHTETHTHTTNTCVCITGDGLVKRHISMQRGRDGFSGLT